MVNKSIIQREDGVTLVELIITMAVFVLVMAAASGVFTGLLTQFKQQSKIAESNIEGIVGLEIMRQDIEHAGYGIPWLFPSGVTVTYTEATSLPASTYNETANSVPRAIISGNDVDYTGTNAYDGSDYLVIRALNVSTDPVSTRWTPLTNESPYVTSWDPSNERLINTDRVMVFRPGTNDTNAKTLVVDTTGTPTFFTLFSGVTSSPWPPLDNTEVRVVYGLTSAEDPVRPFNRADYFIQRPDTGMPSRCALKTGILYKATMNHDAGGTVTLLPLLDCVADMQVVYRIDRNADDTVDDIVNDLTALTDTDGDGTIDPDEVRQQIKEVRVYVLSHEGQKDPYFTYPASTIAIPPTSDPANGLGRASPGFDLTTIDTNDYKYYRWKIYTLIVKPIDLR